MSNLERVKYTKCPLVEVTFQINYPAILTIDANEPVEFQQNIRDVFPNYELTVEQQNELIVSSDNAKLDVMKGVPSQRKYHNFISEDQKWRVILARDLLAFTTIEYDNWEDMLERAKRVLIKFEKIYNPISYSRVGIRYIDAIDKEILGLKDISWDELIQPHILGCLGYKSESEVKVRTSAVNAELILDNVMVNLLSGIGTVDKHDGQPPKEAFILNCDYFQSKRIEIGELSEVSNMIHKQSNIFFRGAITDKLHKAMEPRVLMV